MGDALRPFDVALLTGLISSSKHDYNYITSARVVQAIPRPHIYTQLRHIAANRLPVSQVSKFDLTKARGNSHLRSPIRQAVKPVLEFLSLPDCVHSRIVSIWILMSSSAQCR